MSTPVTAPVTAPAPGHATSSAQQEIKDEIMRKAAAGDTQGVKDILTMTGVKDKGIFSMDYSDDTGMSPLHYAAYQGNTDMLKDILNQDCDPNFTEHQHKYTALHFGALSSNCEVVIELLNAGANPQLTNSISRTAGQMAAFVGNHKIVATINNFIPRSDIEYFTTPQGHQTEPVLPPSLLDQMHSFVINVNLNPVRIALNLQKSEGLSENMQKVKTVLETLCSKEMTQRTGDPDEVKAIKYHYLAYLVGEFAKLKEKQTPKTKDEDSDDKKRDFVELFTKKILKPGKDGVSLDFQDAFLKEAIREFPFRECVTFRNIVMTLGGANPPTALYILESMINGQRGFTNTVPYCNTCGEEKPAKKCSKCKSVQYCDRECQRLHWFTHKKSCNRLSSNLTSAPATTSTSTQRPTVDATELSEHLQELVKMS